MHNLAGVSLTYLSSGKGRIPYLLILVSADYAILPAEKDMHGILAAVKQDAKGGVSEPLPAAEHLFQQKPRPGSPESRNSQAHLKGIPIVSAEKRSLTRRRHTTDSMVGNNVLAHVYIYCSPKGMVGLAGLRLSRMIANRVSCHSP
jgi:hypothetical protein